MTRIPGDYIYICIVLVPIRAYSAISALQCIAMHCIKISIISPMSLVTPLVLVEVEDTMEKEPMGMRTKKKRRNTILELDDESGIEQMPLKGLDLR